jgi:hypothetical protein
MKKIVVASVLAALLFQGSAYAGVIQGSSKSCKIGKVKVDSKYKYTCVKNGLWKKTLLPLKTPVPKKVVPVIVPEPTPSPSITPVISVKPQVTVDPRSLIFPNAVSQVAVLSSPKTFNMKYFVDEGFSEKYRDYVISGHKLVEDTFGGYVSKDIKVSIIMSYNKEFIMDQFYKMASRGEVSSAFANSQAQMIPRFFPNPIIPEFSGAWATWEGDTYVITYVGNPQLSIREHLAITGIHELWHVVQRNINPNLTQTLPCWVVEGQANFIGSSLYSKVTDVAGSVKMMYSLGRGTLEGTNLRNIESGQDNSRVYSDSGCRFRGEYEQGAVANAFLVDKFGFDSVIKFMKESGNTARNSDGWVTVFKSVFGISVEDFYIEVEPYLKWFYNM